MNPLWMSRGLYWLAWANLIGAAVLIAAMWAFGPQWPSALLALLEVAMADAFDAFSHWPRRARHMAIWAVVLTAFAASAAIDEQPAVDERGITWVRIDEIQASASANDLVTTPTVPDHFRP